jgi:hypothetical protein
VLVAWVVALRGGRMDVTATRRRTSRALSRPSQVDDLRLVLAAGLVGGAVVHAAVVPAHLREWNAAGVFFILLTVVELAVAGLVLARPGRMALLATAGACLVPLTVWAYSRTLGLPFGPEAGVPEPIGLSDTVASVLGLGTLLATVVMIRARTRTERLFTTPHASRLLLVAVVATTVVGLGGSGLEWADMSGAVVATQH